MDFDNLFPKDLYHSYAIEGNPEEVVHSLKLFLEKRGEINCNSGDLSMNLYDSFSIEDSHVIKEWYQNKPTDGRKKICIIGSKFINREAEQTLLKIIEEPTDNTHFFIIIPDSSLLSGTILSRVHLLKNTSNGNDLEYKLAQDFFNCTPSLRIEKVADIIKEFKDNENSGGLRHRAITLINGIERIVYNKWKTDVNNKDNDFVLEELRNCRDYLSTPGASVKMVLEHIALVV